jgi:hypothetical protein
LTRVAAKFLHGNPDHHSRRSRQGPRRTGRSRRAAGPVHAEIPAPELERLAARPTVHAWLEQVRKRKRSSQIRVSAQDIVKARDADRR